jgi:hypothetical protein
LPRPGRRWRGRSPRPAALDVLGAHQGDAVLDTGHQAADGVLAVVDGRGVGVGDAVALLVGVRRDDEVVEVLLGDRDVEAARELVASSWVKATSISQVPGAASSRTGTTTWKPATRRPRPV